MFIFQLNLQDRYFHFRMKSVHSLYLILYSLHGRYRLIYYKNGIENILDIFVNQYYWLLWITVQNMLCSHKPEVHWVMCSDFNLVQTQSIHD